MKQVIALLLVIGVLAVSLGPSPLSAQDDECADWARAVSNDVVKAYEDLIEQEPDLEVVAALQELRRDFEQDDAPSCADDARFAVILMFNLSTDAMVAALLPDEDLAEELVGDADDAHTNALSELAKLTGEIGPIASIESPEDGDTVPHETIVSGPYDEELLEENQLWVFLLAINNRYYPQGIDICDPAERLSVTLQPSRKTWRVTAFIGDESNIHSGEPYDISLILATPEQSEEIWALFDTWCEAEDYSGITSIEEYGLIELDYITVIRE